MGIIQTKTRPHPKMRTAFSSEKLTIKILVPDHFRRAVYSTRYSDDVNA